MKNTLTLILLLSCATVHAQDRDLVWLHGLNGEGGNGANFNTFAGSVFTRNSFNRIETSYAPLSDVATKSAGIQAIAENFKNKIIAQPQVAENRMIMIGHSMGGLIAKELDVRVYRGLANGRTALGIITLGAPLNGAHIANAMESPRGMLLNLGSPIYSFTNSIAYNAGRCLAPGGGLIAVELYNAVALSAATLNDLVSLATGSHINVWRHVLPLTAQSWRDLKEGGYNASSNNLTPTPKLNLWASIPSPIFETLLNNMDMGSSLRNMVNYTQTMYDIYRWIPGLGTYMTGEAIAAKGYFLYTIHGEYANLVTDGVSYDWRTQDYMAKENITSCWEDSRSESKQACRKWGKWFRWICTTVVTVVKFTTCVTNEIITTHLMQYRFPTYPETDGVVSASSARGDGSNWKGTPIKVDRCDHTQLVYPGYPAENKLKEIFKGNNDDVNRAGQTDIFKLTTTNQ